jgi:hypothetical protein
MVGCVLVMTQVLEKTEARVFVMANLFYLCVVDDIVCIESVISGICGSPIKSLTVRMELLEVSNIKHRVSFEGRWEA